MSIASDLKRVAMGLHRGSQTTVDKFTKEVLRRKQELDSPLLESYMQKLVNKLDSAVSNSDDALMLSTLFQNYSQYKI
ncbi:MAG: hypothetical protein AAB768_03140 [Patescibacteria group bacterium]